MLTPTLRGIAAALLLTVLVATDALPVLRVSDRCGCGQVVGACCHLRHPQKAMKPGAACHLRQGDAPRCSISRSDSLPASFQSQREQADRPGLWHSRPGEMLLAPTGWIAEASPISPASPLFDPPVPPPRSLRRV
ncbi:MAG: hypothetical protein QOF89_4131 [Acidobacteriota bacterium]|jgi:hypothetical protein|nr:hypothetical protein [Acidobacteriota bacterium]